MSDYNKSKIMKRAWEIARDMLDYSQNKSRYRSQYKGRTAFSFMWRALAQAWEEAKEEASRVAAQAASAVKTVKSKSGRYVEYLSKAVREGLNHGKAWYGTAHNVDTGKIHPEMEGELVCYVYAK